jgi:hypothetical protein
MIFPKLSLSSLLPSSVYVFEHRNNDKLQAESGDGNHVQLWPRARRHPRPPASIASAGPHQPDAPVRPPFSVPRPPPHAAHHVTRALHHATSGRALPRGGHLRRLRRRRLGLVPGTGGVLPPAGDRGVRDSGGGHQRRGAGRPAALLVYDPHVTWVRLVARAAGVPTMAFLLQPCAVDIVYGEVWAGHVPLPMTDRSALRRRGLVSVCWLQDQNFKLRNSGLVLPKSQFFNMHCSLYI